MRTVRDLVKRCLMFMVMNIDGEGSSNAGAPSDSIAGTLANAFAGDSMDANLIPDPDKPSNAADNNGQGNNGGSNGTGTDGNPTPPIPQNTTTDMWMWNELKTRASSVDDQWDIPKEIATGKKEDGTDLSQAERFEMFTDSVMKLNAPKETDDFIQAYQAAKQGENFQLNSFIQEQQQKHAILNASDDVFLEAYLRSQKTEDGKAKHSDTDISDYISKLNSIEKSEKASALKTQLQAAQNAKVQEQINSNKERETAKLAEWENNRQLQLTQTLKSMASIKEIAGMPITESDLAEFEPIFDKMTQFNPKTGQLYMDEYLQSNNENVFKTLYLMHKADKGEIEKHVSNVKESIKEKILNRTGIIPNHQGGSAFGNSNQVPTDKSFV